MPGLDFFTKLCPSAETDLTVRPEYFSLRANSDDIFTYAPNNRELLKVKLEVR